MSSSVKLLLIFIHGFRGDDTTFGSFPERLRHVITNSIPSVDVDALVYPKYDTRRDLSQAVQMFTRWLIEHLKSDKETAVILFGHSMGGLVAADAMPLLKAASIPVLGLLAYDTPFYGLSSGFISRIAVEKVFEWRGTISTLTSTLIPAAKAISGSKWKVAAAGGMVAATVASLAFRDKVKEGLTWATEHLEFASALFKEQELRERQVWI
jgi:pimeloyl-ACP methyl ester carboxylesterase